MDSTSQGCLGPAARGHTPSLALKGGEARQDTTHSAPQEHGSPPATADLAQPLPEEARTGVAPAAMAGDEALDEGRPAKHHLLRHSLPDELRGTEALKHFDVDNARAAIRKINKMPQKELQAAFERVYGVKSASNNNSWLRKKLIEAVSTRGRKLTAAEMAAIGPRRKRYKRRPAPAAGGDLAQPRGDNKAAQALLALLGGEGSGPDQSMSCSGGEEEGGSPHDANSGACAVGGSSPIAPAQASGTVGEFVQSNLQPAAAGGAGESQAGAHQARAALAPKPAKRAAPLEPRPRSKRTAAAAAVAAAAAAVKQAGQYEDLAAGSSSGDEYYHAGPAGPGSGARGMPPHKRTQHGGRMQHGGISAEAGGWGLLEEAVGGYLGAGGRGGRGGGPREGQGLGAPYSSDARGAVYRGGGRGYPGPDPQLDLEAYGSGPMPSHGYPSGAGGGYYGTGLCEQDPVGQRLGYGPEQLHLGRDGMLFGGSSGWGGPSFDGGSLQGGQRTSPYGGRPGGYPAQQGSLLFGSLTGQGAPFPQHAAPAANDMSVAQALGVLQRHLSGVHGGDNSGGGSGAQRYESLRMQAQQAQQRAQLAQQRPVALQEVVKSLQMLIPELDPSHPDYPLRAGAAAVQRPSSGGAANASWVQERIASLQRQQAAADAANAAAAVGAPVAPSPFSAAAGWAADCGGPAPRDGGSGGLSSSLGGKARAQDDPGSGSGALSSLSTGTAAEWNAGGSLHEGSNRMQKVRGGQAVDTKGPGFPSEGLGAAAAAAAFVPQEVPSAAAGLAVCPAGPTAATLAVVTRLLQRGRLGGAGAVAGAEGGGASAGRTLSMLQALMAMQQAAK